jgi:deoxycytidylate deaminase
MIFAAKKKKFLHNMRENTPNSVSASLRTEYPSHVSLAFGSTECKHAPQNSSSFFAEKYARKRFKYYKEENCSPYKDANKTHQYYLQISKHFADRSSVECAKHSAVLVCDNQILSVGINRYILSKFNSTHSNLYFTNNREYKNKYKINTNFDAFTIHAEIDVFIKAYAKIPKCVLKTMPLVLYVVRSQNDCLTLSKPCDKCQNFLKQFRNLKIYFSL